MFTLSVFATDRHLGRRRALGAFALGILLASPTLCASAAELPAGGTAPLVPVSLQPEVGAPAGDSEIKARLDSAPVPMVAGERLHPDLLRRFYAAHNYEPVWNARQAQANALLRLVLQAGGHGLDADLFHAAVLRNPAALSPIERELLLSDAFLSYGDALSRGVLPIESRLDDEDLTPEPVDVAIVLDNAIGSPDPASVIEALAPNTPAYAGLRRALQAYQTGAVTAPPPRRANARGTAYAANAPSNEARIRQIEVNLERQRWLPRSLPADRVWVNIANALLVLYRGDRPVFSTRVVVGEADKQTPELQASITSLLFNPPWNVPRSIAAHEIYPRLSREPDYLARHNMVVRRNGAIQQLPGPHSALGQLKFEMPNRFDVYLHDTPMKALFTADNRRRSHGCVRVQNPRELAAMLLQQPVEVINHGIALGYTNSRALTDPIPVFLVYQTAFVDANGVVEFRPDFYDRDQEIWQHLHRSQQAPMAQHDEAGQRRG